MGGTLRVTGRDRARHARTAIGIWKLVIGHLIRMVHESLRELSGPREPPIDQQTCSCQEQQPGGRSDVDLLHDDAPSESEESRGLPPSEGESETPRASDITTDKSGRGSGDRGRRPDTPGGARTTRVRRPGSDWSEVIWHQRCQAGETRFEDQSRGKFFGPKGLGAEGRELCTSLAGVGFQREGQAGERGAQQKRHGQTQDRQCMTEWPCAAVSHPAHDVLTLLREP